jgi:Peptidase family S41
MTPASAELPSGNLASNPLSAWLKAFNTQDRKTILDYHEKHFSHSFNNSHMDDIERQTMLAEITGGFDVGDIVNSTSDSKDSPPYVLTVMLHSRQNQFYAKAKMTVDHKNEGHPVIKFQIHPTITPLRFVPDDKKEEYERALAPLTPERRRLVVKEISDLFREEYVNPAVGEKIIKALEENLTRGVYDKFTDPEEFAEQLNEDAGAMDKHIGIIFHDRPAKPKNKVTSTKKDSDGASEEKTGSLNFYDRMKRENLGFNQPLIEPIGTKRLGILSINGFIPLGPGPTSNSTQIVEAIGSIMSRVADTDALIIDLRSNKGGSPDTVALIESYLLGGENKDGDRAVHLIDFVDRNGIVKRSIYTRTTSELPQTSVRFGSSKPLFVLTSKATASAGEDMAYNLQAFKRATIISRDKTTAGAANLRWNGLRFVAEEEFGKEWWSIVVPDETPRSTVTGANWEGVGVVSDVVVGEHEDVADVARDMARKALGVDQDRKT